MRALLAILLLLVLPPQARADAQGVVEVIDADTLDVGGTRVRLHGVDAPEAAQACLDPLGRPWACGAWSTAQARALWEGREATCALLEIDRYGREVSRCAVEGRDMGAALVARGAAFAYVAYSRDYEPEERGAEAAARGLWRGSFAYPWDWRRDQREVGASAEAASAPEGCAIKGNVSGAGRIFHRPGSSSYDATRIDEGAGERWFCSEAEAEAAGWRAPRS